MTCPRCQGRYRADDDLEMPAFVCMNCGFRLLAPPPPQPIRMEQRASERFCPCGYRPPVKGRTVCKVCYSARQRHYKQARRARQEAKP